MLSASSSADEIAVHPVITEVGVMAAGAGPSLREVIDPVEEDAGTTRMDVEVTMLPEMMFPAGSLVTS